MDGLDAMNALKNMFKPKKSKKIKKENISRPIKYASYGHPVASATPYSSSYVSANKKNKKKGMFRSFMSKKKDDGSKMVIGKPSHAKHQLHVKDIEDLKIPKSGSQPTRSCNCDKAWCPDENRRKKNSTLPRNNRVRTSVVYDENQPGTLPRNNRVRASEVYDENKPGTSGLNQSKCIRASEMYNKPGTSGLNQSNLIRESEVYDQPGTSGLSSLIQIPSMHRPHNHFSDHRMHEFNNPIASNRNDYSDDDNDDDFDEPPKITRDNIQPTTFNQPRRKMLKKCKTVGKKVRFDGNTDDIDW